MDTERRSRYSKEHGPLSTHTTAGHTSHHRRSPAPFRLLTAEIEYYVILDRCRYRSITDDNIGGAAARGAAPPRINPVSPTRLIILYYLIRMTFLPFQTRTGDTRHAP